MPVITNIWTKIPRITHEGSEINCIGWHQNSGENRDSVQQWQEVELKHWLPGSWLSVIRQNNSSRWMNECELSLSSRSFKDHDNANIHGCSVVSSCTLYIFLSAPSALSCSYSSSLTGLNTCTSPPNLFILYFVSEAADQDSHFKPKTCVRLRFNNE